MPRKKKGGGQEMGPGNPGGNGSGAAPMTMSSQYGGDPTKPQPPPQQPTLATSDWGYGRQTSDPHTAASQDQTFQQLQEMFKGKVDGEIIYMILVENKWQVEQSLEQLLQIAPSTDMEGGAQMMRGLSDPATSATHSIPIAQPQPHRQSSADLALNLRSRLPSMHEDHNVIAADNIPMLSPKTPNIVTFPEMYNPRPTGSEVDVQTALNALDSYANSSAAVNLMPNVQRQMSYSNTIFDLNLNETNKQQHEEFGGGLDSGIPPEQPVYSQPPVAQDPQFSAMCDMFSSVTHLDQESAASKQFSQNLGPSEQQQQQQPQQPTVAVSPAVQAGSTNQPEALPGESNEQPQPATNGGRPTIKRGLRQKTLSLNPDEREALETLIEDVIIGGVGIDSDDSSSETEPERELEPVKEVLSDSKTPEPKSPEDLQPKSPGQNTPQKKDKDGAKKTEGKPGKAGEMTKVYPAQLKVAVKHMKNLPPRFLRKLQVTQKQVEDTSKTDDLTSSADDKSGSQSEPEKDPVSPDKDKTDKEKPRSKEVQKLEAKKKIRDLLDQYMDEGLVIAEKSDEDQSQVETPSPNPDIGTGPNATSPQSNTSVTLTPNSYQADRSYPSGDMMHLIHSDTSPQEATPSRAAAVARQPMRLTATAVNCEDLEAELLQQTTALSHYDQQSLSTAPTHLSITQQPFVSSDNKQSQFSVNAPEFVPRTFAQFGGMQQAGLEGVVSQGYPVTSGSPYPPQTNSPYQHQAAVGRLSPQVQISAPSAGPTPAQLSPEQLVAAAMGRNSPIPAPPFMIPKVPPPHVGPPPPVGVVPYPYPVQYPSYPAGYVQTHPPPPPQAAATGAAPGQYPHNPFLALRGYGAWRPDSKLAPYPHSQKMMGTAITTSPKLRDKHMHVVTTTRPNSAPSVSSRGMLPNHANNTCDANLCQELSPQAARKLVTELLDRGRKVMVILRGCPGSGKSTIARELIFENGSILNTDEFFMKNGVYRHEYNLVGDAHEWNQKRAKEAIEAGRNPIVIDNTNTQAWEMRFYVSLALMHQYDVEIIEPDTSWKFKPRELAQRNTHSVPYEHIVRMLERYQHHLTIKNIMGNSTKQLDNNNRQQPTTHSQQQQLLLLQQLQQDGDLDPSKKPQRRKKRRRKRKRKSKNKDGESGNQQDEDMSTDEDVQQLPRGLSKVSEEGIESISDMMLNNSEEAEAEAEVKATGEKESPEERKDIDGLAADGGADLVNGISSGPDSPESQQSSAEDDGLADDHSIGSFEGNTGHDIAANMNQNNETSERPPPHEVETDERKKRNETTEAENTKAEDNHIEKMEKIPDYNSETSAAIKYLEGYSVHPELSALGDLDSMGNTSPQEHETATAEIEKAYWTSAGRQQDQYWKHLTDWLDETPSSAAETKTTDAATALVMTTDEGNSETPKPPRLSRAEKRQSRKTPSEAISADITWSEADLKEVAPTDIVRPKTTSTKERSPLKSPPKARPGSSSPPHLAESLKCQLGAETNWKLPTFDSPQAARTSSPSAPRISTLEKNAQTDPGDFSAMQKMARYGHFLTERDRARFVTVRCCLPRTIAESETSLLGDGTREKMPSKIMISQSTATTDLETPPQTEEGLEFLRSCFPQVPIEDLSDMLKNCGGDLEWTVNILLESGYDNNSDGAAIADGPPIIHLREDVEQSTDSATALQTETTEASLVAAAAGAAALPSPRHTSPPPASPKPRARAEPHSPKSPQPLMELCHLQLKPATSVQIKSVQEDIAETSVQRLHTINDFQRSHSTGSTGAPCGSVTSPPSSHSFMGDVFSDLFFPEPPSPGVQLTLPKHQPQNPFSDLLTRPHTNNSGHTTGLDNFDTPDLGYDGDVAALVSSSGGEAFLEDSSQQQQQQQQQPDTRLERDTASDLTLSLSSELAHQLTQMFGPVGFHIKPESMGPEDLLVRLNRRTAKLLHRCWSLTLQETFALEEAAALKMMQDDEELARHLQRQEQFDNMKLVSKKTELPGGTPSPRASLARQSQPPVVGVNGGATSFLASPRSSPVRQQRPTASTGPGLGFTPIPEQPVGGKQRYLSSDRRPTSPLKIQARRIPSPPTSLREIMDEEMAIENSRQEYLSTEQMRAQEGSMSTLLKQQKLDEMFPHLDQQVIRELFQANGYSLDATVRTIQADLEEFVPPKTVMTEEAASAWEEQMFKQAIELSLKQQQQPVQWLGAQDTDQPYDSYQTLDDPVYEDYRTEASHHYRLRHECFQKAADAYRRGMRSLASFYSQQGHLHTEKLKAANRRAAQKIMDSRSTALTSNNTVDLHGLHVDEALDALKKIIKERVTELKERPNKRKNHLLVVTGRGSHSRGGVAKIKPAILDFLRRNSYKYTEVSASMLKVLLHY